MCEPPSKVLLIETWRSPVLLLPEHREATQGRGRLLHLRGLLNG